MLYRYAAKTKDGLETKKGEIDAPTPRIARQILQDEYDLIVFSIVPAKKISSFKDLYYKFIGITLVDKVRFTTQLASMLLASLPLTKALDLLISQTGNPNMVEIVKTALRDIEAGSPLSSSLAKSPKVFNISYISLVKAGEASGNIGGMLKKLGDNLEKTRRFVAKVKGAMVYPAIVISAIVGVFTVIMIFVVPALTDMYSSMDVKLPFATIAMLAISKFMTSYWYILIIIVAATLYLISWYKSTESGTYAFAHLALKAPIFGDINRMSGMVEFSGTLALLLEGGVPIIEALNIVKDAAGNVLYRDAILICIEDVKKGLPLSTSIAKQEIFPALVSQMMIVGEETGTVSDRLNSLAEYYEIEVDNIVKNLSTLIEPFIIVILGIMVALLMAAIILPIYQLIVSIA